MDHNLSYRGPILVIQKPNIKFSDMDTISLKDDSQNSYFFPIENQPRKLDIIKGQNRALFP